MPLIRDLNIKSEDERLVEGWCSVQVKDRQGDIIPMEEIGRAMVKYMERGGNITYGHSNKIVGKVINWWLEEHPETGEKGVKILAKIYDDYTFDDNVWKMIKAGVLKGFSIGGASKTQEWSKDGDSRILKDIELVEISLVEEPANPMATIEVYNEMAKGITKGMEMTEENIQTVFEAVEESAKELFEYYDSRRSELDDVSFPHILNELINKTIGKLKIEGITKDDIYAVWEMKHERGELPEFRKLFDLICEVKGCKIAENLRKDERPPKKYWEGCMARMSQYYDEETARKVCGYIFWDILGGDRARANRVDWEKADEIFKTVIVQKPFGKWKNFDDCVKDMMENQGYSEDTAKKVCGKLQAELEKSEFWDKVMKEVILDLDIEKFIYNDVIIDKEDENMPEGEEISGMESKIEALAQSIAEISEVVAKIYSIIEGMQGKVEEEETTEEKEASTIATDEKKVKMDVKDQQMPDTGEIKPETDMIKAEIEALRKEITELKKGLDVVKVENVPDNDTVYNPEGDENANIIRQILEGKMRVTDVVRRE